MTWDEIVLSRPMGYLFGAVIAFTATQVKGLPDIVVFGLDGIAAWFLVYATASGYQWFIHATAEGIEKVNAARCITPRILEMREAKGMTEWQAATVPALAYADELEMVDDEAGPIFTLKTPGGSVPMEWVEKFLRDSTHTELPAIRHTKTGSTERLYLQRFTDWAIFRTLAVPHNADEPATWSDDLARSRAFKRTGLNESAI